MLTTLERMTALLGLIEARKHETKQAVELREKLISVLGENHPDIRRIDIRIEQIASLQRPV